MTAADPDEPEIERRPANAGPRGADAPRSPFTPAARWVAEHQIKVACMILAAASPMASLWMLERGTANLSRGIWAYSVDGAGTIRKLPPPPLPGEPAGATRYFLNAVARDGSSSGLVELAGAAEASLRRAEHWVESGAGAAPRAAPPPKLKRKV